MTKIDKFSSRVEELIWQGYSRQDAERQAERELSLIEQGQYFRPGRDRASDDPRKKVIKHD
jgi:hypothetical protein